MIMTVHDPENKTKSRIYRFLLKLMVKGFTPVLLLGERGFSFYHFVRMGKIHRIPFAVTGNLLSVSAVNMYHIEEIISDIYQKIASGTPNAVPVFVNFTAHYIDENVPRDTADFLFQRDIREITRIARATDRPALFIESGRVNTVTRQTDYRSIIYHRSSLYLDYNHKKITKENLTLEEKEKIYGSSDSGIFHLCGEFIKRMEGVPQITATGGPGVLRRVLPHRIAEYPGGKLAGQSVSDGDSYVYSDAALAETESQSERRDREIA